MRSPPRASLIGRWEALGRPFGHLPRWGAALVLGVLTAAIIWSGSTVGSASPADRTPAVITAASAAPAAAGRAQGDMALYARIHARMAAGEGYYAAALDEHRASGYPARPFVTVRLPTLAWMQALIGADGVRWLALALAAGAMAALFGRAEPLGSVKERIIAAALLAAGCGAALSPVAGYDHDFVAGMLLTLALLAYQPQRWWPALLVAAAALAVRELAAPFAMLWLAFALADRRWHEAAAVAGVLAALAVGLALHAAAVDAARLPDDFASQGWSATAGFGVPLAGLLELTGLRHLPPMLAAPLAVLPLVGWAGLGGRIGLSATLWFTGLATMMALFARPANYYWIELALPAYALGLALAPRALRDLIAQAMGRSSMQT